MQMTLPPAVASQKNTKLVTQARKELQKIPHHCMQSCVCTAKFPSVL